MQIFITKSAKNHALVLRKELDCGASLARAKYVGKGEAKALGLMKKKEYDKLKGREYLFHDAEGGVVWIVIKAEDGNMLAVTVRSAQEEREMVEVEDIDEEAHDDDSWEGVEYGAASLKV